jgi:hypothetical protein
VRIRRGEILSPRRQLIAKSEVNIIYILHGAARKRFLSRLSRKFFDYFFQLFCADAARAGQSGLSPEVTFNRNLNNSRRELGVEQNRLNR